MKKRDRDNFGNKRGICGMIMAAGMAVIAGCGVNAAAAADSLSVSESVFQENGEQDRQLADKLPGREAGGRYAINERDSLSASASSAGLPTEVKSDSAMGSVPYFRDDAGRNTQTADGFLYGYWNNRLCRYDPETLEETVLYEALSPQNGDFCIWGDYVYFMVVPNVNSVGKIHGYLYRVPRDGSGEAVCLTSVIMPGQDYGSSYYQNFILDTYEDILYLIQQYDGKENLYFHLERDGEITRAEESETLYGRLPEGDFAIWNYNDLNRMTLPYAMRNYGYVFVRDEDGNPVRIDPDSQQVEVMDALREYVIRAFTNDAVLVSKNNVWYRASLDDINDIREIGEQTIGILSFTAWDPKGIYFNMISDDGGGLVYFMDWEGEENVLQYGFQREQYSPVMYLDGEYYYYMAENKGNDVVRRLKLTGDDDAEPEEVAVYRENPCWEITVRECFDYGWTDTHTGANVDYSITKVYFREDTGAYGKINDFLEDLYAQGVASMEEYRKEMRESDEEWAPEAVEYSDSYNVFYMDDKYVGVIEYWNQYWKGAAHGMYGSVYYMFDRNTGKRISITDVVNGTPEEICEIIAPYVESVAAWGTEAEGWEEMLLDEWRFFLSEEGIGIHFNVYEIDCYAAGDQKIIVPYGMFELF